MIVHEPPLSAVIADDVEMRPLLEEFRARTDAVLRRLDTGDAEGASRQFIEEVAIGAGVWETLPPARRQTFVNNAVTWADELRDPYWDQIDLRGLSRLPCPVLLTRGDQSFPWFPRIVERLRTAMPDARVRTFEGAGHTPQLTHPEEYAAAVADFAGAHSGAVPRSM